MTFNKYCTFLKFVGDNFLLQVLCKQTRQDTVPELPFFRKKIHEGCDGRWLSTQITVIMNLLSLNFQLEKKHSRVSTLENRSTGYKVFRELFSRVPWESHFEVLGVFGA